MTPAKGGIWGQGISRLLPPPGAGEERRRRGRGGGERRAVSGFAFPGLRPSRDLATTSPAPGRGTLGRASMVFVDGEGGPSPAPPRVISPRSGVWDGAGEGQNQGWHLGQALPGDITCTAPAWGGGGAPEARAGWGREGAVHEPVSRPRPSWALATRSPAPARGSCGRAGMVFVDGEGVPSPAPPRVISPRSGVGGDAGEEQDRGQGISRLLPPPEAGEERRRRGRGGGERRAVSGFAFPGLRPSRDLATRSPAPGRGTLGRAGTVFVDGEGVPSPAPPRVISPRSGVGGDAGEGRIRAGTPGRPFRGISPALPSSKGGERRAVYGELLAGDRPYPACETPRPEGRPQTRITRSRPRPRQGPRRIQRGCGTAPSCTPLPRSGSSGLVALTCLLWCALCPPCSDAGTGTLPLALREYYLYPSPQ